MALPALVGASKCLAGMAQALPWVWLTDRVQMGGQPYPEALLPQGPG